MLMITTNYNVKSIFLLHSDLLARLSSARKTFLCIAVRCNHYRHLNIRCAVLADETSALRRVLNMFRQNTFSFPFIYLFRKSPIFDDFFDIEKLKDTPIDFSRIRCPLCRWQPQAASRWICGDDNFHDGCLTSWNTFDTRGRCPGCRYQWKITVCLRCHRHSPHEAWYENEGD